MNRRISKAVVLIGSCCVTLYLSEIFLLKTMESAKTETIGKINAVMYHRLDPEITIWGASTAWVNFNPKIIEDSLGYSAMNMGIDGTNIDQYSGLLQEYLSYTKNSKYMVLAVDIYGGITDRTSLYHKHNWLHHLENDHVRQALSDIDRDFVSRFKFIPFYSLTQYDKHAFPYFRQVLLHPKQQFTFDNDGFKPDRSASIDTSRYVASPAGVSVEIGKRSIEKIKAACLAAMVKNSMPLVVITPFYKKGLDRIQNKAEVVALLKSLKKYGITVLDFSDTYISENPNYFRNNTHLNAAGADELTQLLVEQLKTINNLHEAT